MNDNAPHYMSTREAAAFLGLSPRTLDRYRVSAEGPVFHKFGSSVRYAHVGDREVEAAAERIGAAIARALNDRAADSSD